jgi:hypothetical protein
MGTMLFQLPVGLTGDAVRDLERVCMAGGPDNMPWPTDHRLTGNQLIVSRSVDESGYLLVPWGIEGMGRLTCTSSTLMERARPYQLLTELARGKINQVRNQAADWLAGGLEVSDPLRQQLQDLCHAFGRAVNQDTPEAVNAAAQQALRQAFQTADALVRAYAQQVFQIRHKRQPQLDTNLACRLGPAPPPDPQASALVAACNTVVIPLSWNRIEGEETVYDWSATDAQLEWAQKQGLSVTAGPLVDFSSAQLPAWLWLWEHDPSSLATFMCRFVEAAVRRYRQRIRRWQLTAASNCASVLALDEDELLRLTYRLVEAARQVDGSLETVVGISQPWGEYMAVTDRTHSPYVFADTLLRSGLNLAALDIELVMGIHPRGSYCRDLLEGSRLLDFYATLGVPLQVTLGYPAADGLDPEADPELQCAAGQWGERFSDAAQADWAAAFAALALCKPFVQGVQWCHWGDADHHVFPHCGLLDAAGQARPALEKLRELREAHLR